MHIYSLGPHTYIHTYIHDLSLIIGKQIRIIGHVKVEQFPLNFFNTLPAINHPLLYRLNLYTGFCSQKALQCELVSHDL